ncbi:MAG: beta-propeller domain-containing protein, partial [Solirubrobacterales bacterium]
MRQIRESLRRAGLTGAVATVLLAILVAVPIAALALDAPSPERDTPGARAAGAELRGFGSCAAVKRYARRHSEAIGGYGVGGGAVAEDGGAPVTAAPGDAGGAAAAGGSGSTTSETNVQEAGIDEPDIVKASGSRVFAVADGKLRALDVSGASPVELGSLGLSKLGGGKDDSADAAYGQELLLDGDRLLVLAQSSSTTADYYYTPETLLSEVDVSDPTAMKLVRTLRVDGGYVDARLSEGTARVVVSSSPTYAFGELPPVGGGGIVEPQPRPQRRRAGGLVPNTVLTDQTTGASEKRRLLPCREIRRPRRFSGLEMLSVLTLDLAKGIEPVDTDSIMTQGDTVYSSADALYVATERWLPFDATEKRASAVTTAIHKFALGPGETAYTSSGEVPGFMLSQWSLSEQDGLLRVASTGESPEFEVGDRESFVTVLGEVGDKLAEVGQVGGLGRGEQIYAVRFIGDVAYVVTFRQVDPLYTVDLSTPTDPTVLGELKVPGYSAYLHP